MLGRFQLGDHALLMLCCRDGSNRPVVPDAAPLVAIYDATGAKPVQKPLAIVDPYRTTGLFALWLFLGGAFAQGRYIVLYTYAVNGAPFGVEDYLEVLPGGDAKGSLISMYWYDQPQASYVVQQLDSGQLLAGRNPSL